MRIPPHNGATARRSRRRERVLKTVAVLPSLATLGNLVCGLGAVYMCLLSVQADGADLGKIALGSERLDRLFPTYLAIGAYLIIGAMFFDGLDGRLARWARKTSEFGGQLDSLADVVSFGVAPAMLVLCIVRPADIAALTGWGRAFWRLEWFMAATFVCCAAVRLARFNVENVEDESAHLGFRGLPTPGAAAALIGLVIFHEDLLKHVAPQAYLKLLSGLLPLFAMCLGLLMISRFRYTHMVNAVLRGRRPLRQVLLLFLAMLVGLLVQFQFTLALAASAYALSGPVLALLHRWRGVALPPDEPMVAPGPDWNDQEETFGDSEDADENARDQV